MPNFEGATYFTTLKIYESLSAKTKSIFVNQDIEINNLVQIK